MNKHLATISLLLTIVVTSATAQTLSPTAGKTRTLPLNNWYRAGTAQAPYTAPMDIHGGQQQKLWNSSNVGYARMHKERDPKGFPVFGEGSVATMVTRRGADFLLFKVPIVAGSLFTGHYNMRQLTASPKKSVKMGVQTDAEPISLKGRYAYTPGSTFLNEHWKEVSGKTDTGTIYIAFYETSSPKGILTSETIYNDPSIISSGLLTVSSTGGGWRNFDLKLTKKGNKSIDFNNKHYKVAIVFSSSKEGDDYRGAIGSMLKVSNLEVTFN